MFYYFQFVAQFIRGYGIKIGTTISNQDWNYNPNLNINLDPDNRIGLNIGVFAELLNTSFLSIVTEVNYLQKGMEKDIGEGGINPDGTSGKIKWDTRVDYINFSALGKLRINYGIMAPFILLGPKYDVEINKVFSLGSANTVEEKFNKNRVGFKLGIGTEIKLAILNFLIEFIYDKELTELYKNEYLKIDTSSMDIRVGIMF